MLRTSRAERTFNIQRRTLKTETGDLRPETLATSLHLVTARQAAAATWRKSLAKTRSARSKGNYQPQIYTEGSGFSKLEKGNACPMAVVGRRCGCSHHIAYKRSHHILYTLSGWRSGDERSESKRSHPDKVIVVGGIGLGGSRRSRFHGVRPLGAARNTLSRPLCAPV